LAILRRERLDFKRRRDYLRPVLISICTITNGLIISSASAQDEIAAFRFTGFEGYAELRFREDEQTISQAGLGSTDKRSSFEEEIFFLTHSYIYHPNFLKMDLGFGPLFTQSKVESSISGSNSDDSSDVNLKAYLRFLDEKPYPLLLYYEQEHPYVSLSLTDRFQQENKKYGFDFQIRQPVLPFKLALGAFHQETKGEGLQLRTDDVTEQKIVRADIPMGTDGYGTLTYTVTDVVSRSGFTSLPVTETAISTDTATFDSRVSLGDQKQFTWTNFISHAEQKDVRPLEELRYNTDLRWRHSEATESFYRLGYLDSDQQTVQTTNYNAAGGFRHDLSKRTTINAELHSEENETTNLTLSRYGVNGAISHKRDYEIGTLNLSAGWNYDINDQQVAANVPVRDLQIQFTGTTPQFLPHNNIIQSSITVARLIGGTEVPITPGQISTTCSAGIIVAITTIGARTQVNICSVSDAVDPYIFDYDYDPGGSVNYGNFVQSYQASLSLYRMANLYVRWRDSDINIRSGAPTQPLAESTNTQTGARIDYPFNGAAVGGEITFEKEEGSLLSYDRDSTSAYVSFDILGGSMRLGTHQTNIDYQNSTEDVKITRNELLFRARPLNLFTLTATASAEKDTGGSIIRDTRIWSLNAEWRVRRLIMKGEARVTEEEYGETRRDRSQIQFVLRRDF